MTELILHHYDMSPFGEKVRLMLGYKQLAWRSVHIPPVMPKPDVVALTGGYRKTPVLQVGADVYCDTALIARVLETAQPSRSLYPRDMPLAPLLAQWADGMLFGAAVSCAVESPPGRADRPARRGWPLAAGRVAEHRRLFGRALPVVHPPGQTGGVSAR